MTAKPPVVAALAAALLFGASTPFANALVGDMAPVLLAGLFYLGSGIGLWAARIVRDRGFKSAGCAGTMRTSRGATPESS
jgi:hypothetical protein